MKVLLIEDDLTLGESLKEYLEINGIKVEWISDDRDLENIFSFDKYDVIVLDLILKYSTGEQILQRLRNKQISTPVLILTAKSSLKDKEICFNYGADDYLTKPFESKELLLRLKALNKRQHLGNVIKIGDLAINLDAQTVYKNGKEIKLSKKSWELLNLLIKNRGNIVNTQRIINYVWGDKPVGDEIVRTYIKELRKILPSDSIETYKGRGYKLQ
jgi:DNA-binding response OmpR family regulator